MTQKCNLFFCLPRSQRESSDLSFFLFLLFFFSSCSPSVSFSPFPIAFSECNLVWWAGGLFWISQCFWLPPLACGAFSWSQSCRPGLEGWRRRRRRRRSSKSLGIGDLNALQSEPCRAQIERVILLLKLSAAPQMAFVQARDMLGDQVKATASFRLGESLCSAGKALWARQLNTLLSLHFSTLNLNSRPKQNRWIRAKEKLYFSAQPLMNTHEHQGFRTSTQVKT